MAAIYGFRRVLKSCHRQLIDLSQVYGQLKAQRAKFLSDWGDHALVPQRGAPVSMEQQSRIMATLDHLDMLGWSATLRNSMKWLVVSARNCGWRNDEMARTTRGTFLKRANFVPFIDGVEMPVTPDVLRRMQNGQYVRCRSVKSKCDQTNAHWGGRDMWFVVDDTHPWNLASQWVQYELAHPCPLDVRHQWPAFSPTGDDTPFTTCSSAMYHRKLCSVALGADAAALITIHWWRVTMATAALTVATPAEVQCLGRWKTDEAMRIYAKMLPSRYASIVEAALRADAAAASNMGAAMPQMGPQDVAAHLDGALSELGRAAGGAQHTTRAPCASRNKQQVVVQESPGAELTSYSVVSHDDGDIDVMGGQQAPHAVLGEDVQVPDACWPGYEHTTSTTRCKVTAYVPDRDVYILDTGEWGMYLFSIDDIRRYGTQRVRAKARKRAES